MPIIDKELCDFTVNAFHQGEFIKVSKEDVVGKWAVFCFYPADFSFVCPTELEDLAKHYDEFRALDCEVYSISCDSHYVHAAWHAASEAIGKIEYPMLADPTHKLAKHFDVLLEEDGTALRGTFLLNPEGKVQIAEVHADGVGRSAKDLIRKLKAARYVAEHDGEVCPAAWEEGSGTLRPSLDLVGKI